MAQQHQVILNINARAGSQRFDPVNFIEIDRYALQAPPSAMETIDSLALYLVQSSPNELGRVRAAWRWITAMISYDTD
ncbi:MAG TPA: hypothetical protein PKN50_13190, partial [Spirochaetota bacterium]|nr:hypothetical protein [Spirochaetota bacterium]